MKFIRTFPAILAVLILVISIVPFEVSADAVPPAPTDLECVTGEDYVDLDWRMPMGDDSNVSYFLVYRGGSSNDMHVVANISANQTAYHDGGLELGTSNYYVVTAVNSNGESTVSNAVSATTASSVIIKTTPANSEIWVSVFALVLSVIAIQVTIIVLWVLIKKSFK